jgi:PKD repeat protein
MGRGLAISAGVVAVLLGVVRLHAPARTIVQLAPLSGTACHCTTTGHYERPKALDPQVGSGSGSTYTSPTGKYDVTLTSGIATPPNSTITVTDASTHATVYTADGVGFSFGHLDRGFVVQSENPSNGVITTTVTDLTAADPHAATWSDGGTQLSNHISFSPRGDYFAYAQLNGGETALQVVKVGSTEALYSANLFPSGGAPSGGGWGTSFGSATWGFAPRSQAFAYAYTPQSTGTPVLDVVNLSSPGTTYSHQISGVSAYWVFSPCGDVYAIVTGSGGSSAEVKLYRLSDDSQIGQASGAAPVLLASTATEQVATFADNSTANLAPNECTAGGGGGGGAGGGKIVASFTHSTHAKALTPVTFTDASVDTEGTISSWAWDFGDGTTSSDESPHHAFQDAGTYTVSLTVSDGTNSAKKTVQLTVAPHPKPKASFTYSPSPPAHAQTLTLTSTSTDSDPDNSPQITWKIGNDFLYGSPATYQMCKDEVKVKLTATDEEGVSASTVKTIDVSNPGDTTFNVPGDGSLADAATSTCPGDTVKIAPGTYTGGVTLDDVNVVGSGQGKTIISGDGGNPDANGWVLTLQDYTGQKPTTDSDFDVTGGQGGLLLDHRGSSSTTLERLSVYGNTAQGGIAIGETGASTAVTVDSVDVHDNTNDGSGSDTEEGSGGGLTMFCCSRVTVENSTFSSNTSSGDGGGLYPFENDGVDIENNLIENNHADGDGGGLYLGDGFGSKDLLQNNDFEDNTAGGEGGGLMVENGEGEGPTRILDNRFRGNGAGTAGGVAAYNDPLFAGNLIAHSTGGAITGLQTIADSTIVDNSGGGIVDPPSDVFVSSNPASDMRITNTIVAGNGADFPADADLCHADGSILGTEPAFKDTTTYDLAPGSIAIDAGANDRVPKQLATDAEGNARIENGVVDVGYVESPGPGGTGGAGNPSGGATCDPQYREDATGTGTSLSTLEDPGVRKKDPIETTIAAPASTSLEIHELNRIGFSRTALEKWSDTLVDGAPGSPSQPYSVTFDLDKSLVANGNVTDVLFGGTAVPVCSGPGSAAPDPCVSAYSVAQGKTRVTVLASDPGGIWTFRLAPLANVAAPTVSGTPADGQFLTGAPGTWGGTSPVTLAYQWLRCAPGCAPINGATNRRYKLQHADVGATIELQVTGTNASPASPLVETAAPTATVAPAAPSNVSPPTIDGTAQGGVRLVGHHGAWGGTPTIAFAYQWKRCDSSAANCQSIAGATDPSYLLTPRDVGQTIELAVSGSNGVGRPVTATSAPTGVVAPGPVPQNTTRPSISGTAEDGDVLTATRGAWNGSPTSYAYQWERCDSSGANCVAVSGATGHNLLLRHADVGSRLVVLVTATNAFGTSSAAASVAGAVVLPAPPANTAAPSIEGAPVHGEPLTGHRGTWSGTPTITYVWQWLSCNTQGASCVAVGAGQRTYTPTSADVGRTIELRITATNAAGGPVVAVSAPTAPVG